MRSILVFMILLAMAWQNASAREWNKHTELLPQYCKDRAKGSRSPEWNRWRSTFGEAFIHIHHYCGGIYAEQLARSELNKSEKKVHLGYVVTQMRYVSGACKPGCVIYPELHTRWGWALGEQGKVGEAIRHYQLAIKAKNDYTPAYVRLSETYLGANQPDEARKILEAGLQAMPDSRALRKRLDELDSTP